MHAVRHAANNHAHTQTPPARWAQPQDKRTPRPPFQKPFKKQRAPPTCHSSCRSSGPSLNRADTRQTQARPPFKNYQKATKAAHLPQQLAVLWPQLELRAGHSHARHWQPEVHKLEGF